MDGEMSMATYDVEEVIEGCTVEIWMNRETGERSVGWRRPKDGLTVDYIINFLGAYFGPPCEYTLDGVDACDVINGPWCDANCNHATGDKCWRRFLTLWKEREDG